MKDATKTDFAHVKRVCNDFKTKMLGEYDLHVQSIVNLIVI